MTGIMSLWLPIVVSAVAVFITSSILHMFSPWHKSDYRRLPDEEGFRAAVGPLGLPPGDYMVPRPMGREDMRSEAFLEKYRMGPNVVMTVLPTGSMSMGRSLGLWFLYLIVVGVMSAYVASRALTSPNPASLEVVRFAGTTAFTAYCVALWQMTIWYRRALSTSIKATVDGLIYALITGAIFAYFWPV